MADSQGNFLLIGPLRDAHDVFLRLLDDGVLIRETSMPGHLRVSIGTPDENERFRTSFRDMVRATALADDSQAATGEETKEHR